LSAMSIRKFFAVLLLAIFLVISLSPTQSGQALDGIGAVDQANVVPVSLYDSIQYFNPIGQSFMPAFTAWIRLSSGRKTPLSLPGTPAA
jgi:hypothetical protein